MNDWLNQVHVGDCCELMRAMIADEVQVQSIVTSPPYWGLRDYGTPGQIGLEKTLTGWIASMVEVFELARALLAKDGTLWLNLGDAYSDGGNGGHRQSATFHGHNARWGDMTHQRKVAYSGLKSKELMGQAWRVALALQDAGWYLRSDIIWHKPNPMPESVRDRPTKSHEYIFLMSKSRRYYYDGERIAEATTGGAHSRGNGVNPKARANGPVAGWATGPGNHCTIEHNKGTRNRPTRSKQNESMSSALAGVLDAPTRNARTVWTIATEATSFAHFATFPRELARRCILAGTGASGVVFDPFMGSGTVAEVALSLGRQFIGCEINGEYAQYFKRHRAQQHGMAL